MRTRPTIGPSLVVSLGWHVAVGLLLVWVISSGAPPARGISQATPPPVRSIVWLARDGDGRGGGGGGDEKTTPARRAERIGRDRVTVPVTLPTDPLAMTSSPATPASPGLEIAALNLASALESLPGAIQTAPGLPSDSLGPGKGGGAGDGEGQGDGPGRGRGLGPGRDRNQGGGAYRMGGDVSPPVPLYRATPRYTPEAVQARVQGSVFVECIVQTTGQCTDARVVQSMQPPFGLDREAIAVAGEWRFRPGQRAGEQVAVLVTIEVAFTIR